MDLLLIGGVSGSGKNVALGALEDSGYYAVNNLPLSLVEATAGYSAKAGRNRVAIALDAKIAAGARRARGHDRTSCAPSSGTCAFSTSTRRPKPWSSAFPRRAGATRSPATCAR
jgi:predicted ATPase